MNFIFTLAPAPACAVTDDDVDGIDGSDGSGVVVVVIPDRIRFETISASKHRAFPLMKYKHCVINAMAVLPIAAIAL